MDKFLVIYRYDDEYAPRLETIRELANRSLEEGQLAGVLSDYVVYRLIPDKDPIRLKAIEDFGCGWMSITLYDRFNNLVDSITIDRP
ncbi:MAG: hypothetical protein IJ153_05540 [Clostridia bacterium]|nr:hypothetical protein [Clostridia bacterium]MBQ9211147.1 hypothetical protein [Clostridia bacterium]